jgi:hypothetical protein
MKNTFAFIAALGVLGCQTHKPAPTDQFSTAGKADDFSSDLQIVGTLKYGASSGASYYRDPPQYHAFRFDGAAGDAVDVWVRSPDGDAVAWVLDGGFQELAWNDDADDSTTDAHVTLTLPAGPPTHYIVFRDYYRQPAWFTVELGATSAGAPACADDGGLCYTNGDCCSGSCSADRVCIHLWGSGGSCAFDFGGQLACRTNADCCSGHCGPSPYGSFCSGLLPNFYFCTFDQECDSNICADFGYCATWRSSGRVTFSAPAPSPAPPAGASPICVPSGGACTSDADCCNATDVCGPYTGSCVGTAWTGTPCTNSYDCGAEASCLGGLCYTILEGR